jgi:hypothetical protein
MHEKYYNTIITNCITIGILCLVLSYTTVEVQHKIAWNGLYITQYRLLFFQT